MADPETNLKIKADTRDLAKAGKAVRDTFSPMSVRQFNKAVADGQKELKRLVGTQLDLAKALAGTAAGSKAFKELAKQMRDNRTAASALKATIDTLRTAYSDLDKAAERSSRRRQGFLAGLAQGAGVTQYMPTGPGMMPRAAGAMVGHMGRRLGHGAAAPFLAPGLGGLSTMLGSIPLVGGFAAGALQSAQGYFQQAAGYSRAKIPNLYWAGGPGVFQRGASLQNFYRGGGWQGTAGKAEASELKQATAEYWAAKNADEALQSGSYEKAIRQSGLVQRVQASARKAMPAETAAKRRRLRTMTGKAEKWGFKVPDADAVIKDELEAERIRADRKLEASKERLEKAEGAAKDSAAKARSEAWMKAAGGLGGTKMFSAGFGTSYGFAPEQVQQMLGAFMGARGGTATKNAERQAEVSMAANVGFGVSMQTAGKFTRLGGMGAGAGLAGVLNAAVQQGLEGSLVPEYLDQLVSMGEESLSQGMKVRDIGRLMSMATQSTAILGALGVEKLQRGSLVQGLGRSAQQLSAKGVSSPSDLLMLRAAGYDPGQGGMGYIRAIAKLDKEGMSPETMVNLIQLVAEGTKNIRVSGAEGADDILTSRAMFMSRMMGTRGVPMKIETAKGILASMEGKDPGAYRSHLLGFGDQYGGGTAADREGLEGTMKAGAKGLASRGASIAVATAQLSASQIGAGSKLAGTFIKLEHVGIKAAGALGQFAGQLETVVGWMSGFVGVLDQMAAGKVSFWDVLKGGITPKEGDFLKKKGGKGGRVQPAKKR